jgi:hypothetical protein
VKVSVFEDLTFIKTDFPEKYSSFDNPGFWKPLLFAESWIADSWLSDNPY